MAVTAAAAAAAATAAAAAAVTATGYSWSRMHSGNGTTAASAAQVEGWPPVAKRRRVSPSGVGKKVGATIASAAAATPQASGRRGACLPDVGADAAAAGGPIPLADLAGGPYFMMASCLDASDLSHMDAVCHLLLALNGLPAGPWRLLGDRTFLGMELEVPGGFLPFHDSSSVPLPVVGSTSWKARCEFFHREVQMFSLPFASKEIMTVDHPDAVAYCRCRLRTDWLSAASPDSRTAVQAAAWSPSPSTAVAETGVADNADLAAGAAARSSPSATANAEIVGGEVAPEMAATSVATYPFVVAEAAVAEEAASAAGAANWPRTTAVAGVSGDAADGVALAEASGVYVEVEVKANADNLSLAVVDFEGGGHSSVTFSPETGAVLRERRVRELPRAIEGTYIHLLPAAPPGRRFEGTMGLFLSGGGHLAFFRRWAGSREDGDAALWETTGFCTDLRWAQGPRLSPCLAFRDNGTYQVRISRVGRTPPVTLARSVDAYQEDKWGLLYGDDDHALAI
eukprot:TRINITY_DN33393_c0_g1_i1.p1 TRINITY_DN33393_c0_g1~~TRINITY_DN33393_c0_g1_i1.p1  ORF type:complete len:544 (-),score=84.93 TRINITY_DN33393_c0_g1_i1:34-1569(-)